MVKPTDVTDGTWEAEVLQAEGIVVVDFWAPWAGQCRMFKPVVEELADEYAGKIVFRQLNTDENPTTAMNYGIRSIPTLIVFKAGEPISQTIGFRPKSDLKKRLEDTLKK